MWAFAEEFIINGNVWTKNQAIMDLGAILCVSSNPRCYICPMSVLCEYYKQGTPGDEERLAHARTIIKVNHNKVQLKDVPLEELPDLYRNLQENIAHAKT